MSTLHDFSAATLDGKPLALNTLAGKLVLVVNTASRCGLTPHYAGLETLYKHYADQGLVVLKYAAFDEGINVTLGLPFVRTSPDHGTAFDIAGSGRADASSLIAALRMARRLAGVGPQKAGFSPGA